MGSSRQRFVLLVAGILLLVAVGLAAAGNSLWPIPLIGAATTVVALWPPGRRARGRGRTRLGYLIRTLIAAPVTLVAAVGLFVASTWLAYERPVSDPHYSIGPNAVWSRHQWVGDPHTPEEYDALAAEVRANRISDAFFHVGPLEGDGTIPAEKCPNAETLIAALEERYPELRIQAWIGQLTVAGGGPLELDDPAVRNRIVETARTFLDLGFDGIHYNVEPLPSGDRGFVELLRTTSEMTRARGAVLSIASEEPDPTGPVGDLVRKVSSGYHPWTYEYYSKLAGFVDQFAVMSYDSGIHARWVYAALIRHYTERLIGVVGERATLFIGVPSYDDQLPSHAAYAENVESALIGVQQGMGRLTESERRRFGVAIYAQWTTGAEEWETYRRLWLGAT